MMILLVVDAQELLVNESLYMFETWKHNIQRLIQAARNHQVEVVYVIHDDGPEAPLSKGKRGYETAKAFAPLKTERIFEKTFNSPFKETGLLAYLKEKGISQIIAVGLQTDFCMDATIKCGFEHGFEMIVPAYTNSTVDNQWMSAEESYRYYNEYMWPQRYGQCITLEEAVKRIEKTPEY